MMTQELTTQELKVLLDENKIYQTYDEFMGLIEWSGEGSDETRCEKSQ